MSNQTKKNFIGGRDLINIGIFTAIIFIITMAVIGESGTARYFPLELKSGDVNLENLSIFQREAENGTLRRCMFSYTEWIRQTFLKDDDTKKQFVKTLKQSFEFYRDEFMKSKIRCHGSDYFYLISDAAHKAVRKFCEEQGETFSISKNGLIKALAEEKLIETGDKNTKETWINMPVIFTVEIAASECISTVRKQCRQRKTTFSAAVINKENQGVRVIISRNKYLTQSFSRS